MVLSVVEAVPASSKPPAVNDSMRASTGGRYGFGASAPLLTRAASMHFSRAGGLASLLKLVKLVRPSSARAEEISSYVSPLPQRLRTLASLLVYFYV